MNGTIPTRSSDGPPENGPTLASRNRICDSAIGDIDDCLAVVARALSNMESGTRTPRHLTARRLVGLTIVCVCVGWAVFVVVTHGSAEERYFRTCTGSCLAEMPDSYPLQHALLAVALIAVPWALVAGAWFFARWVNSSPDK